MRELVLTGDERAWPQEETKAVFLGPWCFANHEKHQFLDQKNFELIPSPWKTPQNVLAASRYIDALIDRLIGPLSETMNEFHGLRRSERFWNIYTINWLVHWLGHCYERFRRLQGAGEAFAEKFSVRVIRPGAYTPASHFQDYFEQMMLDHGVNLALFSELICRARFNHLVPEFLNGDEAGFISNDEISKNDQTESSTETADCRARLVQKLAYKFPVAFHSSAVHLGSVYGVSRLDKLFLSRDPLFFLRKRYYDVSPLRKGSRDHLASLGLRFDPQNEFEGIVKEIIFEYIPEAYLAIYPEVKAGRAAIKTWIGNDIYMSEKKAFMIASVCEEGGQWLSAQHGGGYGHALAFPMGKIEYESSDGFITWGWEYQHVYPARYHALPSPMLSKLPKYKRGSQELVYISTAYAPYCYRLSSKLVPEDMLAYWEKRNLFFDGLTREIHAKVGFRPYPREYVEGEWKFVEKSLARDQFILHGSVIDHLKVCKLAVIDHMETSFLQTFTMNVPTILFWDPSHFPVVSDAQPYFDCLAEAKILFYDQSEAAGKVNEIWADVDGWWHSSRVRSAKDFFCSRFARSGNGWRREWANALKSILGKGGGSRILH